MKYIKEYIDSLSDGVILIIDNTKPPEKNYLSNVIKYLESRNINYVICADIDTLKKNIENNKTIGSISTGSDYRVSENENLQLSYYALENLRCPILGLCFGFQSMAKFYGSEISQDELLDDLILLDNYDPTHQLFSGIDLNIHPVKFCFHDFPIEVPPGFRSTCEINDKIAGIYSNNRFGLLFHPEDTNQTYKILDNFIQICKSSKVQESKIIKSFRLFESQNDGSGNASFNWLKKQNNEKYFELVNILQTEILDDYKIYGKRDESFASDNNDDWPNHKFWAFRLKNARSTDDDFSEFGDLKPEDEIASVTIYNAQEGEKDEIFDLLLEIRGRVRGYLNKEMVIFQETVVGGEYDVVTDIVIKLEDIN
jgi:GMP synthase-like glutamine amidotransferase